MKPPQFFLKWLGREVYSAFVPLRAVSNPGAENYLVDLWREAPLRVAFTHTALAISVIFLPLVVLPSLRPFPWLSASQRENFQKKLSRSKLYHFRLIAYGMKGHALVATFRDEPTRQGVFSQ